MSDGRRGAFHDLRERVFLALALFAGTYVVGVLGYRALGGPGHGWMDAAYMTANVLTTVGFREAIDTTNSRALQGFTIFLLLLGTLVVVYFTSAVTAFIVEGDLTEGFRRRRMQRMIESLTNHFIVCGGGQTGYAVMKELITTNRGAVLIEGDTATAERAEADFPGVPVIVGDFTEDLTLDRAGIERAAGVVFCADSDKDSLVGTVTARQRNPKVRIIARASDERAMQRLRTAGADGVVSPGLVGGLRMVSELVRPSVVGFLDKMLRDKDRNLRIEEIVLRKDSALVGRSVGDIDLHALGNVLLMAVREPDEGAYVYNPGREQRLRAGATLIFMTDTKSMERLKTL